MIKLENLKSVSHSDELNIVQIKEDLNKKQIFTLNVNVDILKDKTSKLIPYIKHF